jgi:hypothetical protein
MLFGVWNDIPRCGVVNNTGSLWREFPILLDHGDLTSFETPLPYNHPWKFWFCTGEQFCWIFVCEKNSKRTMGINWWQINVREYRGGNINEQSRETGNTGHTRRHYAQANTNSVNNISSVRWVKNICSTSSKIFKFAAYVQKERKGIKSL